MVTRRRLLATAAALPAASCFRMDRALGKRPPNLVLVLADDMRWDSLGCAGHPFLKTPRLDRLAAEGARFANAFTTTPFCASSRASILTGIYAHRHDVLNNYTPLPERFVSFPAQLQARGFETAYIGKWLIDVNNDAPRPGFNHWASHRGMGDYAGNEFNINGNRQTLSGYYTNTVTSLALDWLKGRAGKPFALLLGHKAAQGKFIPEPKYAAAFDNVEIHRPVTADPAASGTPSFVLDRRASPHGIDGDRFGHASYEEMVRAYHATLLSLDDSVGALYDALARIGELDNTLFIVTSDNGQLLGEHASIDKRALWEESIRIPLLMRHPATVPKPIVVQEMVLNQDLAPTVLDVCEADPLVDIPSRSCRRLMAGELDPGWRKSFYLSFNFDSENPYTPNIRAIRTEGWKYIHYPIGDESEEKYTAELYNLLDDPRESRNLISDTASREKLTSLKHDLRNLQRELGTWPDTMPLNPQLAPPPSSPAKR